MQLFMRGVNFRDKEDDIKTSLATIFHRPPFTSSPNQTKINFDIRLFYPHRSHTHRGSGLLTLPDEHTARVFLRMYPNGLVLSGRTVKFTISNRPPDRALIQKVASSPWEDPLQLRREQQRMLEESSPIPLARASFGRFCPDGVFSPEVDVRDQASRVVCDVEKRQLRLEVPSGSQGSVANDLSNLLDGVLYSARYNASSIAAIALTVSPLPRAFIEALHPPMFVKESRAMLEDGDNGLSAQRLTSLFGQTPMPPVSRGLCLTFSTEEGFRIFSRRIRELHLPPPILRSIHVEPRNLYSSVYVKELDNYLQYLPFPLAFEIEKAILSGLLVPQDIIYNLKYQINKLNAEDRENAAKIFNAFVLSLDNPGIESIPVSRRPVQNRRRRKRLASQASLGQRLADEAVAYVSRQYLPRGRLALNQALPNAGIYQAYHLHITPTGKILEGPLPDQSNSVLRQFGNHECFLRVTFQDETGSKPRRDFGVLIDDILTSYYKPILVNGVKVAGRDYSFLGYSMSGLKDYAFAFVRPFEFDGVMMDAHEIRDSLGDFSRINNQPALLAARWSQAFSASDPSVILDRDSIQFIEDRYAADGSCVTDGVGTISLSLAREVHWALQEQSRTTKKLRKPPSAYQFRLGGAKGVLTVDPRLQGRVVCLRRSQRKFEGTGLSLDISTTSARPISVYLNRAMIALLEHHGVSGDHIKELQTIAIVEVNSILESLYSAAGILSQHGLGSSFRLPSLLKNIYSVLHLEIRYDHGLDHQLLITTLHYSIMHILRDIKHRAHIPVPGSFTLIGVADEWDCLKEGEIYATVVDDRTRRRKEITGDVLVTRSPQIHPGDMQMVTAVRRPELAHLTNVVVFSCRGKRSLPSMLGGGDLDGDIYNLILDPRLHPPSGRTSDPGDYTPLPRKTTSHTCTVDDVADFVIDFIKTDLLGMISILHLRIADLELDLGPACESCLLLAEKASHAVDFPKTGTPVDLRALPRPPNHMKPDFLSGEGVNPSIGQNFYPSLKLLGDLYRNVPDEEFHPNPQRKHVTDGQKILESIALLELEQLGLPPVQDALDEELLTEMGDILEEYSTQLYHIAKAHTTSKRATDYLSEAELVSGTIQAKWVDPRRRREAVASMNMQTHELASAIRREFRGVTPEKETQENTAGGDDIASDGGDEDVFEDFDDYDGFFLDQDIHRQTFTRALAAWQVAEEALEDNSLAFGPASFGLLALGMMLGIVNARRRAYQY